MPGCRRSESELWGPLCVCEDDDWLMIGMGTAFTLVLCERNICEGKGSGFAAALALALAAFGLLWASSCSHHLQQPDGKEVTQFLQVSVFPLDWLKRTQLDSGLTASCSVHRSDSIHSVVHQTAAWPRAGNWQLMLEGLQS